MNSNSEISQWIYESIFWIGILIMITGILFMLIPGQIEKVASRMNRWICTNSFFHMIDRPRNQDRVFYRYHKIVGTIVVICSIYIFYVFLVDIGYEKMVLMLEKLANTAFTMWLYPQLLNILLLATVFSLLMGVIIFIRPSALKDFENWSNRWFDTNAKLKVFDTTHSFPEEKVKRNSRIFGLIVFLCGCYITASMYIALSS